MTEIAEAERLNKSRVSRILRVALLAPDMLERGRDPRQGAVHRTVSSRPNRTDMSSRTWAWPASSFSTTVSF